MKMRTLSALLAAALALGIILPGCSDTQPQPTEPAPTTAPATEAPTEAPTEETAPAVTAPAVPEGPEMNHEVVVYFANWKMYSRDGVHGGEVASLPWDSISYINHAFWGIEPAGEEQETSFQRRDEGLPARTEWRIVSTAEDCDLLEGGESDMEPGLPKGHFAQYAVFSERYPHVNILISIGGWSRSGYFSEMAATPEGRASFTQACVDLMNQYPWIDGIDIDWEYPAGSKDGERVPEDDNDQGCPIFSSYYDDRANMVLLFQDMRAGFDAAFGEGAKKLTACASGSTGWTLPCQDWAPAAPYLDLINVMTYDLAGTWDATAGHGSSASLCKGGVMYLKMEKIPLEKLCGGSPMYATVLKISELRPGGLNSPIEKVKPTRDEIDQTQVRDWESQAVSGYELLCIDGRYVMGDKFDLGGVGWHYDYDTKNGAAYMWNDDPASPNYLWYVSYDNPLSIQEKMDYMIEKGIAGLIVWESSQDTVDHALIRQMGQELLNK